jgi:hypothetical protein
MPEEIRPARKVERPWGRAGLGKDEAQRAKRSSRPRSKRGYRARKAGPRLRNLLGDFSEQIGAFFG